MRHLRVVMAQLDFLVGDIAANVSSMLVAASRARDELDADIILFPELAITGYPPEDLLLRPGLHGRVLAGLEELKRGIKGITAVVGYPRHARGGLFNAVSVVRDGAIIATYHKQFLPNYSVFDEKRYFTPGAVASAVFEVNGVTLGLVICEDVWMHDPVFLSVQAGAQLVLVPNASPYHCGKQAEREQIVSQRARENGVPLIYANLVGGQDELVFDGGSFVVNHDGQVVQRAPAFTEDLYLVEFSVDGKVSPVAAALAPLPDEEESVYQALVLGVRDYINKNGFKGAVIGLSGGIDSALTLAVAVDAIGAQRIEAVMMPSRYTADMSLEDARAEAELLGVRYREIAIEPAFNVFIDSLADEFAGLPNDTTEENIQARCRGVILMAISNKTGKMVLTTGNKSEMAVGYATLYGDMAGGFDVLKDVPKTLVYRLSNYRNAISPVIPQRVIDRPPSAELAPDQVDQDSLPPYDELDAILERYVERDQCAEDIVAAGFNEVTVRRVIGMVDRNEYKRRQAAPGVRVTRRAFGRDRRYPITSGFNRGK